jgi:hypothetical protein
MPVLSTVKAAVDLWKPGREDPPSGGAPATTVKPAFWPKGAVEQGHRTLAYAWNCCTRDVYKGYFYSDPEEPQNQWPPNVENE